MRPRPQRLVCAPFQRQPCVPVAGRRARLPHRERGAAFTEQPPPPPPRRWFSRAEFEADGKAEEMYNQIAAWYKQPENAALRARWGAFPEPEELQTWPGFVRVTRLDATVLDGEAVTSPASPENVVVDAEPVSPKH